MYLHNWNISIADILKVLSGWSVQYGGRFKIFIGLQPYLVLANAGDIEKLLSSQSHIDKSPDYELVHQWLGLSLLTSTGSMWSHRRKQLTPAFHFKILEDFLRVFNGQCSIFREVLHGKGKNKFDIFPVITHCALDIICETAMGKKVNAQQQSDSEYVEAIYKMSELVQYRQLRPWLHPDFTWKLSPTGREEARCLKILHEFTEMVINERKQERKDNGKVNTSKEKDAEDVVLGGKKRLAFLDLLLEAQESDTTLTDLKVREETDTFMFEGHDTTAAGVGWATFLLACNPEIQAKVHEELDSIFGEDRNREVTMTDLTKMKYLESCIKESLRVYPSVPFIGRHITSDLELADKKILPAGTSVYIVFYNLHRDASMFPDPEKFDPDRFLPENSVGRHPYAYAPFSAGPRNCIGQKFALMEEKVVLSTIFRSFRVKAMNKREEVEVLSELISRPEGGIHVMLEKR